MNNHDAYKHSKYSVVIHGDSWKNNIMINDQSTIRFIDFQQARIGSVVQDLSYFFYTCCEKDDYELVWYYLKLYHDYLLEEMNLLGADTEIFTFESLMCEWKKFACYGFGMSVVVLHGLCSLPEEFPSFAKVLDKGENIFRSLNFTSKLEDTYFEKLCALIHHFIELNLFPK
ncbi:PREDICTED: uncharacterized protein LOC108567022 [Nicrophorus vespilloides]|uniref:Uncharacterized protein LOC108567022 n=1 Tax=Nicrophorus vespilloides TaxID=110193 RepID=A0ABM1N795_NICVS|nr:PREDICTED: uncharacterized protein LOC108567022 [Nicrophorus vespilloides]